MQKPVTKNLMKWKSSVPPAPFVAFSPCTEKVPRSLFSTGFSKQLTEQEASQGEPALLCSAPGVSAHRSAQTAGLAESRQRSRVALLARSFLQCTVYTASHHGEGHATLQKTGAMALQMLSTGSLMLTAMFCPAQARAELQHCC